MEKFFTRQQVEIVSEFILESSKYVLSIIQYKMGKDGTYIPMALLLFKKSMASGIFLTQKKAWT